MTGSGSRDQSESQHVHENERASERRTRERKLDRPAAVDDLPDPPVLALTHYPRMLRAYWSGGENGLEELEQKLRVKAAAQPTGKFSKDQALYVPFVPLPPLDWRHKCGHCRFWVDHGPGEPGECMIVGREGDQWGGKAIHEKAGCALFTPPAGEPAFAWIEEQLDPTGADLVRGEFHREEPEVHEIQIPVRDAGEPSTDDVSRADAPVDASTGAGERARRHTTEFDVGTSVAPAGPTVALETVVEGLAAPIDVAFDPAGDRRFVADQAGLVHLHGPDGLRDEPLLDLNDRIVELEPRYDERGLLGLELHPDFAENGRLFVRYSAPRREGTPEDYDHTEVLAEFRADEDRSPIDPESERAIMEIPHPRFNHNAAAVAFGPDGYLYVPMGDGGGEGDTGFGHVDGGNGQDVTENRLGCVMRIDVDSEGDDGERNYAIPDDNPLVGEGGIDELYAWGLRNPWSMSFDSAGDLFVADAGQALFEEVNLVEKGRNYGWNVKEGTYCFDPESPQEPPKDCPDESERGEPLIDPIVEYPHVTEDEVVGSAVVGGARYEGAAIPALDGEYVFGDWAVSQDRPSGRLWAASPPGDGRDPDDSEGLWEMEELVVENRESGRPELNVLGFARDPDGELYLLGSETHAPTGETGAVYRIVPPDG